MFLVWFFFCGKRRFVFFTDFTSRRSSHPEVMELSSTRNVPEEERRQPELVIRGWAGLGSDLGFR